MKKSAFYLRMWTKSIIFAVKIAKHNDLGEWGEAEAACYLEKHGYIIRDIDWRFGKKDIDVIAITQDGEWMVFVEVKTRQDDKLMDPSQAVTPKKILNLATAANAYIKMQPGDFKVRFDIISIVGAEGRVKSIQHTEDAFNPLLL